MATSRSEQVYADFVLSHLATDTQLLDVGCGDGELSLELAARVGRLIGIDADPEEVDRARAGAERSGAPNTMFEVGDVYQLPLPDGAVDVVFGHSVLESLDRPERAVAEIRRVLRPGGLVAVASVEYGGLVLAGPHGPMTRRFYDIRERLWLSEGADPYRGRELRGLLVAGGFSRVEASTTYLCYGTEQAVREFGLGRADDCIDEWYAQAAQREHLATSQDLTAMHQAWLEWSESPSSYAAFAWCRALGWKD